jgi:glycosylphosphatidylinositol transamidase
LLGFGWMLVPGEEVMKAIYDWEILAVWFAPFVCFVYSPLVLQAGIASPITLVSILHLGY